MAGLNRAQLLGNVGQDPELKVLQGGQSVLNLRLATTETWLDKANVKQERTDWHSVTIFGKRAEALSKLITKGAQLYVEGRIQTRSYEKNGEKRFATDVVATNVILTGSRKSNGESRPAPARTPQGSNASDEDPSFGGFSDSPPDEIPF